MSFQKCFNQYVNENQKEKCRRDGPSCVASFRLDLYRFFLRSGLVDGVCPMVIYGVVDYSVMPAGAPAGHIDRVASFPDVHAVVYKHRVSRARLPHNRFRVTLSSFHRTRRPTASAIRQAQGNRRYEGSC